MIIHCRLTLAYTECTSVIRSTRPRSNKWLVNMKFVHERSSARSATVILTEHLVLRPLQAADAPALLQLRLRNREAFRPYDPDYPDSHFTLRVQLDIINEFEASQRAGTAYGFGIFLRENNVLIGRIALRNVIRGVAQSGTLGFFLDQDYHSKGYMTETCASVIDHSFIHYGLHRIDAAVMPSNLPSRRVFEKLGFLEEGLAQSYLHINGAWRDHIIFAMTLERWTSLGHFIEHE